MNTTTTITLKGNCHLTWYLALKLRTALSPTTHQVDVLSISQDDHGGSPAITIRPEILRNFELLGLSEQELFTACDANFLLGTQYRNTQDTITDFPVCFSKTGINANGVAFHHYWSKLAHANLARPYWMYSLGAALAINDKFYHPSENPRSINSSFSYGYTLNAFKFRDVLMDICLSKGVTLRNDRAHSKTTGWEINCVQNTAALNRNYQVTSIEASEAKPTILTTRNLKNIRNIAYTTRNKIIETSSPSKPMGKKPKVWTGTTIDLGPVFEKYSGFESTNFSLLETTCEVFLSTLHTPTQKNDALICAFNNILSEMIENTDIFTELHQHTSTDLSNPKFYDNLSPKLQRKLEQFQRRGRLVMFDNEPYSEEDWTTSMLSLGIIPKTTSISAIPAPINELNAFYSKHLERIQNQARSAPSLYEYLNHLLKNSTAEQNA